MDELIRKMGEVEYVMKIHDYTYDNASIDHQKEIGAKRERKILDVLSEMPCYLAVEMIKRFVPEKYQELYFMKLSQYSK